VTVTSGSVYFIAAQPVLMGVDQEESEVSEQLDTPAPVQPSEPNSEQLGEEVNEIADKES